MRKLFLISMAVAACGWATNVSARTIHGVVVDAGTDEPLIGATVMPIGGGQGAACGIDGDFTINVPDNVKKATVSYVGYTSKTVDLSDNMTIRLAAESSVLDDLVVVAYGTATRESLTGSVAVVGAKEIEDRPLTSATQALEGNAPGVQVNSTTGEPGSEPTILIRGFSSITGSNTPLYVVDQVPFFGSISDLNPADIESMTVLKDAASCALYGVQAANGVVMITTKKAKSVGKTDVTLSIREGFYERGLPNYSRMKANQWMESAFGAVSNQLMYDRPDLYPDRATTNEYLQQVFVSDYLKGNNIYNLPDNELFDANGRILGSVLPGYTDLDWWDMVGRTGMRQEYNVNVASATDKSNVFASVGYLNEKGYLRQTDFERFNARFNMNFQPTSYLRMGINLNGSMQEAERSNTAGTTYASNAFRVLSYAPIYPYYSHGADGQILYDENGHPVWNFTGVAESGNIAYELRHDFTRYKTQTIDLSAYATAIIPYGFELTLRGNMNRVAENGKNYMNPVSGSGYAAKGSLTENNVFNQYHNFQQQLNWGHQYGDHHVDVFLSHENTSRTEGYNTFTMENLNRLNEYWVPDAYTSASNNPSGTEAYDRIESYLGRARYNYADKYFGEFSIRRDGTARLSKNNRWGTFWSVGGSWVISKESFMHPVTWVDYLKLRAAYGAVGNYYSIAIGSPYSFYTQASVMSNTPMVIRSSLGNPDLKWEASRTFDIGLEGSLFHNRLNFTLGYFDKRSDDLIFNVPFAASNGYQIGSGLLSSMTTPMNIGAVSNHGFELSFNGTIMETKDFRWTASLDATFYRNTVKGLPLGGKDMANGNWRLSEGKSMYEWYVNTYAGVDQMTGLPLYELNYDDYVYQYKDSYSQVAAEGQKSQMEQNWQTNLDKAEEGGYLVEIGGKLYSTSPSYATKKWHGTALPTVYGSIGTNLTWKGISLGLLFTYSLGGKTMDNYYANLMTGSDLKTAFHTDLAKSWKGIPEGMTADSPNRIDPNGIPQQNASLLNEISAPSSRWLTNSSYLVLKNVNLSYDLPLAWSRKLQLQNINLGVSIDNLFTICARKGMNPQQTMSGSQSSVGTFGTARVFSFQLTARF